MHHTTSMCSGSHAHQRFCLGNTQPQCCQMQFLCKAAQYHSMTCSVAIMLSHLPKPADTDLRLQSSTALDKVHQPELQTQHIQTSLVHKAYTTPSPSPCCGVACRSCVAEGSIRKQLARQQGRRHSSRSVNRSRSQDAAKCSCGSSTA